MIFQTDRFYELKGADLMALGGFALVHSVERNEQGFTHHYWLFSHPQFPGVEAKTYQYENSKPISFGRCMEEYFLQLKLARAITTNEEKK